MTATRMLIVLALLLLLLACGAADAGLQGYAAPVDQGGLQGYAAPAHQAPVPTPAPLAGFAARVP